MSRLVLENIPQVTEEKLLELFSPFGSVTDVKLMYKTNGNFRCMAQIGFLSEEQARAAQQALNGTFIKGRKIAIMEWAESKIKSSKDFYQNKKTKPTQNEKVKPNFDNSFTIKLKNLPKGCKKSMIKKFFSPLKLVSIRNDKKKRLAYVKLSSDKDMQRALKKDKSVIEGSQVKVIEYSLQREETRVGDQTQINPALDFELLSKSGRLFIRNLSYQVTEDQLTELFEKYGPIKELYLPFDTKNSRTKGIAFVTLTPEKALQAFSNLDRTVFQGRILHIIPAQSKESPINDNQDGMQAKSSYKKEKIKHLKESAEEPFNWNSLFLGIHALLQALPGMFNIDKQRLLNPGKGVAPAVISAMGETQFVAQMKKFLKENGINIDSPLDCKAERSKNTFFVKNLPANTDPLELRSRFDVHGTISRFIHFPDYCIFAIIEFKHASCARKAFNKEAYSQFHNVPLFLEWAPQNIFVIKEENADSNNTELSEEKMKVDDEAPIGSTLYVKNLNFNSTDDDLRAHFSKIGKIVHATIAKNKQNNLSHGFGFVEFEGVDSAKEAMKQLQHSLLDDHKLELSISKTQRKSQPLDTFKTVNTIQKGSKLLVRNIAFQANKREVTKLFESYGKLRFVRLPKKLAGTGSHRGFAFIEFVNEDDAKKAYESMKDSTHFYGRRLVLEWAQSHNDD